MEPFTLKGITPIKMGKKCKILESRWKCGNGEF
jgi:hypothetical protein